MVFLYTDNPGQVSLAGQFLDILVELHHVPFADGDAVYLCQRNDHHRVLRPKHLRHNILVQHAVSIQAGTGHAVKCVGIKEINLACFAKDQHLLILGKYITSKKQTYKYM